MLSKIKDDDDLIVYKNQLAQVLSVINKQLDLPKDARVGIIVLEKLKKLANSLKKEIFKYEESEKH